MDGHQRVYWDEIRTVQSLIEQCLQKYMTQVCDIQFCYSGLKHVLNFTIRWCPLLWLLLSSAMDYICYADL